MSQWDKRAIVILVVVIVRHFFSETIGGKVLTLELQFFGRSYFSSVRGSSIGRYKSGKRENRKKRINFGPKYSKKKEKHNKKN